MLTTRVDPRASILFGLGMQVSSGLWLMSIDLNVPLWVLAVNAYMQGLAVGLIWAPMTTSAFWTLDPALRAEGISVFHLMRNIGSSFFISLSVAEVVRSTGANYSRLVEYVSPYNRALSMPVVVGSYVTDTLPGLAAVSREVTRQAALIGYVNAFFMYTMASAIAIPLVFLVRRRGPAGQLSRA
jgi:DHA2 family multidrug resistance protein